MSAEQGKGVPRFKAALEAATASLVVSRESGHGSLVAPSIVPEPEELTVFAGLKANFIAHLIATARHLPQTRVLRRADPEVANQVYQPVRPIAASRKVSREA